jgi:hypothetical protein
MKHEGAERASEEVQEVRDQGVAVLVKEPYMPHAVASVFALLYYCVSICTFARMRGGARGGS